MMRQDEYARMAEQESTYWWHLGRLRIIDTYLRKAIKHKKNCKILNVGCGTGGTITMLESFGQTDNVDISGEAIRYMKQLGYKRLTKVDDIALPFKAKSYDIVSAFDVLEHIEKHVEALKEWKRVLKDDGAIVLTVPAYQWLWSDHDISLHHKRRYTIKRLTEAARQAGLEPTQKSYAITFSLPLVIGFRFLNKVIGRKADAGTSYVKVPRLVNKLFTNLLYAEALLHRVARLPVGTSVIMILRKAH